MHNININKGLGQKVSSIKLACIACDVLVEDNNAELWTEITETLKELREELKVEDISKITTIAASRTAYKKCGKDPARYRLSAEALLRRILKRGEIYQVNNVVDLLNLVSVSTGFSIGGYDENKIVGDIVFGTGETNEPYEGIGRGELNIEFMPVFRDDLGAFGTSTSDSVRTCVSASTKRFLMIIVDYGSTEDLNKATEMAVRLLTKYAKATNFELETIQAEK